MLRLLHHQDNAGVIEAQGYSDTLQVAGAACKDVAALAFLKEEVAMRRFAATALILCLLLGFLRAVSIAQEQKSPPLEDDLKALQGEWRGPGIILSFRDYKTLGINYGGDASGSFSFELKEKHKKRYIVFQSSPKTDPTWMSYRFKGKQLLLTVEAGKFAGVKSLKLTRVEKIK